MVVDPVFWCLAILGVLLTGISKSGFAGGAGVVAVPLMSLVIPIQAAVVIMLPLLLLMDARTISYYWQNLNRQLLVSLVPAALVGITVGGFVIGSFPAYGLGVLLGLVSIAFAAWQPIASKLKVINQQGFLWGSVSGFTSTIVHAGGPPINIYLMSLKLPKLQWLATAGVFFGVMNLVKIIPYTLMGGWSQSYAMISIVLVPFALLGVSLGKRIQQKISEQRFMVFCRLLLLSSGVILLYKSLMTF